MLFPRSRLPSRPDLGLGAGPSTRGAGADYLALDYAAAMLKGLAGGLLALIVALAFVQDGDAKPRTFSFSGGQSAEFRLQGSNGYKLEVNSHGMTVDVTATGRGTGGSATYIVRRHKHGERGFEAKLPGVGRIAVEFRPRGKATRIPLLRGCTGRPGLREDGVFVGTINFHGERGYTEVTRARAHGTVRRTFPQTCRVDEKEGNGGGRFDEKLTGADLVAVSPKGGLLFSASLLEFGDGSEFPPMLKYWAGQFSFGHGMQVIRFVFGSGPLKSFSAEHTGRTAAASAEPAAPFTGSADFAIAPDGAPTWTGNLSVSFPGTGPMRLAGKRFKAQLCVDRRCAGDDLGVGENGGVVVGTVGRHLRGTSP